MNDVKILEVSPFYPPHVGGVERYVHNLSRYLAEQGHEIRVVCSDMPRDAMPEAVDGIEVRRKYCLGEALRNPLCPGFFFLEKEFSQAEIINVHNVYGLGTLSAAFSHKRHDAPLILTHHGTLRYTRSLARTLQDIYHSRPLQYILANTDQIIVLSQADARFFEQYGYPIEYIEIIPNAIDLRSFEPYQTLRQENLKADYGFEDRDLVLCVGALSTRKGVQYLVEAIRILIQDQARTDIALLIIGSGECESHLHYLIGKYHLEDSIVIEPRVAFPNLVRAYKSADLFVLPSLAEGMPTTMIEAMFFDLPMVATAIPGVVDHFSEVARLVPPCDCHALASTIENALQQGRKGYDGEQRVRERFTWEIVGERYCRIYQELLDRG